MYFFYLSVFFVKCTSSGKKTKMPLFKRVIEVVYSTSDIWIGLPYVLAAAGVFAGGLVIWCLFNWILQYIFLRRERQSHWFLIHTDKQHNFWGMPTSQTGTNMLHLFFMCVFFSGIVFIVWISSAVAGLNPWTSAATTLTMGVIITYSFAGPLNQLSSAFTVLATNSIGVGQYWEFAGMDGYDGFILSIENTNVYMSRYNEATKSGEIVYMPMANFVGVPRKRNFNKEKYAKKGYGGGAELETDVAALPQAKIKNPYNKSAEHMV